MRRWRPGHLLASWAAYWVGLAGAALGPAVPAVWRATHLPDGHGTISAAFDNSAVGFSVIEDGVKTFTASTSAGAMLAWIIVPPMVLWLVWLAVRERPKAAREVQGGAHDQLSAGSAPANEWRVSRDDRVAVERKPVRTPNP